MTLPCRAGCTRDRVRSKVDLPIPLAPTNPTSSPSCNFRLISAAITLSSFLVR
ncbi:hypothetical protein IWQ47_002028 [Aquimarina sp. EL_43]|uniref:hypothetical protein n=1 Tax=Aquimarina TaxID=290174 RepID=UPI001A1F7DDF|nr:MULTISPECIES: hypothetical protein [Aquimarina]MBG6130552.1 hypothetical protein [Aquimarina sp. EL_35]MBG6151302.1 hypothetical protein [Aquimarina sp. EL_32]MBG6168954.1 hypothetical protein [Aquimarina sp. EL_43]